MASEQRVLIPQSLPDLFGILKRRPESMLWAGGTYIGTNSLARLDARNRDLVSLRMIEDLSRIIRTDRFLDIGAMVSLERILRLSPQLLPFGLKQALIATVPAPTRSLATLGGNLCIPGEMLTLLPWFAAMDGRLELRRQGSGRFEPAGRFLNEAGVPDLEIGEILTRIRIPLGRWNHQCYRRVDASGLCPSFAIIAFAEVHKDIVEDLRICIAFSNRTWFIHAEADSGLVGERLPLSDREISDYCEASLKETRDEDFEVEGLLEHRYRNLIAWFLRALPRGLE